MDEDECLQHFNRFASFFQSCSKDTCSSFPCRIAFEAIDAGSFSALCAPRIGNVRVAEIVRQLDVLVTLCNLTSQDGPTASDCKEYEQYLLKECPADCRDSTMSTDLFINVPKCDDGEKPFGVQCDNQECHEAMRSDTYRCASKDFVLRSAMRENCGGTTSTMKPPINDLVPCSEAAESAQISSCILDESKGSQPDACGVVAPDSRSKESCSEICSHYVGRDCITGFAVAQLSKDGQCGESIQQSCSNTNVSICSCGFTTTTSRTSARVSSSSSYATSSSRSQRNCNLADEPSCSSLTSTMCTSMDASTCPHVCGLCGQASSSSSSNVTIIALAVVAALLAILVVVGLISFLRTRNRSKIPTPNSVLVLNSTMSSEKDVLGKQKLNASAPYYSSIQETSVSNDVYAPAKSDTSSAGYDLPG